MSKINFTIQKDKAEIMFGAVDENFHRRGFKPSVRMGSIKETLAAACIFES